MYKWYPELFDYGQYLYEILNTYGIDTALQRAHYCAAACGYDKMAGNTFISLLCGKGKKYVLGKSRFYSLRSPIHT
jgi:hypothetical protein